MPTDRELQLERVARLALAWIGTGSEADEARQDLFLRETNLVAPDVAQEGEFDECHAMQERRRRVWAAWRRDKAAEVERALREALPGAQDAGRPAAGH